MMASDAPHAGIEQTEPTQIRCSGTEILSFPSQGLSAQSSVMNSERVNHALWNRSRVGRV